MRSLAAGRYVSLSRSSIVGLLGMAGMLGCGDSQGPSTIAACPDNVVTVSVQNAASAAPSFGWTPACPVALLEVSALPPASGVVWSINGRMQNILSPGIVYGQVPLGAEEVVAPVALQSGVSYEVRVARAVSMGGSISLSGSSVGAFTH